MTDENNKPTDATTWRCPKCGWSGLHTETAAIAMPAPGGMVKTTRVCPKCFAPVLPVCEAAEDEDMGDEKQEDEDILETAAGLFDGGEQMKAFFLVLSDIATSLRGIETFPEQFTEELAKLVGEALKGFLTNKAKIMDGAFNFGMKKGFAGATAPTKPDEQSPTEKVGPLTPEEIENLAEQLKGEDKL